MDARAGATREELVEAIVAAIEAAYEARLEGRVAVLCGRGNNGGGVAVVGGEQDVRIGVDERIRTETAGQDVRPGVAGDRVVAVLASQAIVARSAVQLVVAVATVASMALVTLLLPIAVANEPVPEPVTSPVSVIVWSPELVPVRPRSVLSVASVWKGTEVPGVAAGVVR